MAASILFRIVKGFLYGVTIGLFFATAIFVLASSVAGLGFLDGFTPTQLAAIIFGAGILSGVTFEYGGWLEEKSK